VYYTLTTNYTYFVITTGVGYAFLAHVVAGRPNGQRALFRVEYLQRDRARTEIARCTARAIVNTHVYSDTFSGDSHTKHVFDACVERFCSFPYNAPFGNH
jgi:hypothetical protein